MKTLAIALTASTLAATAALASGDISTFDANGDRFASITEIQSVLPGVSAADFREIDLNDDRRISATELVSGNAQSVLGRHTGVPGAVGLAQVDTNGDNFVNFSELAAAYPGVTSADWNEIDVNDDRRLSSVEFQAGRDVVARYSGAMKNAVVSLNAIDTNGSSFADFGEVAAAYPGLSSFDFDDLDTNDDNRVSFSELYAGQNVLARK